MNKKEREEREEFKNDIFKGVDNIVDGIERISTFLSVNDGSVNNLIGGEDIRFLRMLSEHRNTTKRILSSMDDAFEMDKISHSPKSISLLKEMAEKQIEDIRDMDVWEMIQCDQSRYSNIRRIYERAGTYLYPSDLKKDDKNYKKRMDLYREYSHRADEIFRTALEDYYHTDKLPQKTKDKLWGKAWEQGHSAGYNDVACAYGDLADVVMSMVE